MLSKGSEEAREEGTICRRHDWLEQGSGTAWLRKRQPAVSDGKYCDGLVVTVLGVRVWRSDALLLAL